MRRGIMAMTVAGLALSAFGQGMTLHFESDTPAVIPGGVAHWVVRASFTGYTDPTAYFGGFVGEFPASNPPFGDGMNFVSHLQGNAATPIFNRASIENINAFQSSLLHPTLDFSNPMDLFEFDIDLVNGTGSGSLSFGVQGVASVFSSDFIFTLPDEYTEDDMTIVTDELVIGTDVEPMPGVVVSLRADRAEAILGETVTWTIGVEFTGWEEPGAYVTQIEGDLVTDDPLVGLAREPVSLIGGETSCRVEGASMVDLYTGQPVGGPYDTANPIDLATFEVQTLELGVLEYDLTGRVVVQHPAYAGPYRVRVFDVTSDVVDVVLPGCNRVDLVEPWDVLDAADITAFVELFLAQNFQVDFVEPYGVLDLADLVAFVVEFEAGCP